MSILVAGAARTGMTLTCVLVSGFSPGLSHLRLSLGTGGVAPVCSVL